MRFALALGLLLFLIPATPVQAQPSSVTPDCPFVAYPQYDMAGVYVDPSIPMRVRVFPCGGVTITWDNLYGRHEAHYVTTQPLVGGGLIARGHEPDPRVGYLDGTSTVGVKPAEPGFVQVITVSPYGEIVAVYRLPKFPS